MTDTIFAMSSGALPAAIAIIRISGSRAITTLERLAGSVPALRRFSHRTLKTQDGRLLDRALVVAFRAPDTATGEDVAELHVHGGRAVVAAIMAELATMSELRAADAGEFTRRAFLNSRIDLGQAEALSDLLVAETEWQRRAAAEMAGGRFARQVEEWRERLLVTSAAIEAELDFSDEGDVEAHYTADALAPPAAAMALGADIRTHLAQPCAERLRNGVRVVLAGPPNSGKSSLFNALVARDAAIVSDIPGTTRDVIEAPLAWNGIAFVLSDTAGLRQATDDMVETVGVKRACDAIERSDILLWLGEENHGPKHPRLIEIDAKADLGRAGKTAAGLAVSAHTGSGLARLIARMVDEAEGILPAPDAYALNQRQRTALAKAAIALEALGSLADPLLQAEQLRYARSAFDELTGRTHTEDMLDHIFSGFCIGK